ncbi:hypothetical protein ACLK1G_05790 [Pseudomonas sp. NR3]|uniref:hypothetical protein n=1 Tax=Pseudomonas sp. NR3 TaxID=3155978 RepID=UPI003B6815D2
MALRGYPGIHAGIPTTQYLRSASVVNGAFKIKSRSEIKSNARSKARQNQKQRKIKSKAKSKATQDQK